MLFKSKVLCCFLVLLIGAFWSGRALSLSPSSPIPYEKVEGDFLSPFFFEREGVPVNFKLPKDPNNEYSIYVLDEAKFLGMDAPLDSFVTLVVKQAKEYGVSYPVGIQTSLYFSGKKTVYLGWGVTFDYPALLEKIRYYSDSLGVSFLETIGHLLDISFQDPLFPQLSALRFHLLKEYKNLYGLELDKMLPEDSDRIIEDYLRQAPQNLKGLGLATARMEFLSSFFPLGGKVEFFLSNKESLHALAAGKSFEETLFGKVWKRLGFEVVHQERYEAGRLGVRIFLEKTRTPKLKIEWQNRFDLGAYVYLPPRMPQLAPSKTEDSI